MFPFSHCKDTIEELTGDVRWSDACLVTFAIRLHGTFAEDFKQDFSVSGTK